jgi:hypothetical protein
MTVPGTSESTESRPRDANWAGRTDRLKVSDAPQDALNLNVEGRHVVGPLQGFGQLWQKTYQIRLEGVNKSVEEVVEEWKHHFPEFQPPENRFYPSVAGVKPGEVVLINAMTPGGPVSTGVMVLYSDEESFTLMTPEGHPESGWVTFSAFEQDGTVIAQVQSLARANDPMYEAAFRVIGSSVQEKIWRHVLTSLAAHFGLKNQPVSLQKTCVDAKLQWSQARNIWHNAQIRTLMYIVATPIRWVRRLGGSSARS